VLVKFLKNVVVVLLTNFAMLKTLAIGQVFLGQAFRSGTPVMASMDERNRVVYLHRPFGHIVPLAAIVGRNETNVEKFCCRCNDPGFGGHGVPVALV